MPTTTPFAASTPCRRRWPCLRRCRPSLTSAPRRAKDAVSRTPPGEYEPSVEPSIEAVRAGEVFQIQVGQRFEVPTDADPLDVYRVLRTLNPSPYMYFLRLPEVDIVGCSPEALVTVHGKEATIHPIAGTRKRGDTPERDAELVHEMLNDPKERAEHVMLVDLARNDLGRVAAPGSVQVVEFGAVERYSHVWHIVSTVEADVAPGKDAFDVLTATFPAGTLTGAPKVRAMELIDELEPVRRGLYGGAVGYLDAAGDLDMAIAIRTAIMRDGIAYVQAGAGIVADSVPALEDLETRNKARAVLQAIGTAETLRAGRATPREPTRPVRLALGAAAIGAGGALLIANRDWQTIRTPRDALPVDVLQVSGRDLDNASLALALVGLAGVVAILATQGWLRRGIGASSRLAGAGLVWRSASSIGAVSAVARAVAGAGQASAGDLR